MRRLAAALLFVLACTPKAATELPDPAVLAEPTTFDVAFTEQVVETDTGPLRVWLYAPNPMPKTLGVVVVPPAGSNLLTGMTLGEGDRAEHEPYVRKGYVVVSFDIAGPMPQDDDSDAAFADAVETFRAAEGGYVNAVAALDAALAVYPSIEPNLVFAAGHSSAGTLALTFAARDERVQAVAAYAAVDDVVAWFPPALIQTYENATPGFRDFLWSTSPSRHRNALAKKPVFLFHAQDDSIVPPKATKRLFEIIQPRHPSSVRKTVAEGDHYDAMVVEGIPAAIEWFESLRPADRMSGPGPGLRGKSRVSVQAE